MVHNAYTDPYARKVTAHIKRRKFEKMKKSNGFYHWKIRQMKVQCGKCAYCMVDLNSNGIVTHIDHVTPLYYDGKNDYSNFVLSCKRCNMRKWVSNKYVVPEWIRVNDEKLKSEQRLRMARNMQKTQMRDIIDDVILEQINSFI